jgi:hypothetical protein
MAALSRTGIHCGLLLWLIPLAVQADAIMRSEAMFAETIAEIYVDDDTVVMELEIGANDLPAFRNLLPDSVYQDMGYGEASQSDRLKLFSEQDIVFVTNGGTRLTGQLTEIGPAERLRRDSVTGEPLTATEGVAVVRARLVYELEGHPETLSFGAGATMGRASIGYVLYHKAIAVNDFRYLTGAQELHLDWSDPWYSSFRARALRRSYFAPMSGFIYVEPYEVRKEIILRPKDLQYWLDLGLEGKKIIPAGDQAELKRRVGEFLRSHHEVLIDGVAIEPELARINFLERTLKSSRVIDPPVDLDIDAAILGAIFVYPTVEPLPQKVTMRWDLFNDRIQQVPGSAVDQAGPMPSFLDPEYPLLEWENFLKQPILPTLTELQAPPSEAQRMAVYLRWVLLALTAWLGWRWYASRSASSQPPRAGLTAMSGAILTGITFWVGSMGTLSQEASAQLVGDLLHNVYRAFDFRDENRIYDVLDRSVEGELLTDIYLETRRGLELESQGGARAKVKNIEIIELSTDMAGDGVLQADVTWRVDGSVGHWGHVHQRQNQYEARLTIAPVEGSWKLTELEILSEERI